MMFKQVLSSRRGFFVPSVNVVRCGRCCKINRFYVAVGVSIAFVSLSNRRSHGGNGILELSSSLHISHE